MYERKGVAGLESKRNGNQNASKFTPEVAVCIKAQMQVNRCMTERELAEQIPGIKSHTTAGKHRKMMGYKPRVKRYKTHQSTEKPGLLMYRKMHMRTTSGSS